MASLTLQPSKEKIAAFLEHYASSVQAGKNPYMTHFLKLNGASVSIYQSGKVLFQGDHIAPYTAFFGHLETAPSTEQNLSLIGTDEVGNGSYFGGLAVVASFVTPDQHDWLRQLGVGDSKTLTDTKILELAPLLKEKIQHQALLLSPQKYNEVIENGYNAVSVKVALHNQAIFLLLQRGVEPEKIVIDAFTTPKNYDKYLQKESNHFPHPVDLIEKAEGKFLAVAVSSILARTLFLENLANLSQQVGIQLPSGAGSKSDQVASQLLRKYGMAGLAETAKLHFKNTEKAQKLLKR